MSGYVGPITRGAINQILAGQVSGSEGNATATKPFVDLSQQTTTPSSNTTSPSNYSTYSPLTFSEFQNNPANYIGQSIIVTGMNDSFIPSTGSAGSTNFVEVENPFDLSQPKFELEIPGSGDYAAAVNALQNKSVPVHLFVRAYGTGLADQSFTETSLLGSANVSLPTVLVTRLDQCLQGSMNTTVLTGTSFESNFSCSQWQTIFPAGVVQPTPTQSNSQSTAPTPTCNLSASPSSITSGQSSEISWSSTNTTSGYISGIGYLSSLSSSMEISPSVSTNYVGTFSGSGGSVECSAAVTVSQSSQTSQSTSVTPTLSVTNSPLVYNGSPQTAVISSSIPGNIVSVEYNGSATAPTMPGTYAVTADFAPSTNPNDYSARLSAGNLVINAGSSTVTPANQTISFGSSNNDVLQNVTYGIVGFTVDAQASSGLGVSFTAQGACTVTNDGATIATGLGTGSVLITGTGSCTITASQAGNEYYNPAPNVSQTFTINPAPSSAPSSDANLSALAYNGTAVSGFDSTTYKYVVDLPDGSTAVAPLAATADNGSATVVVTQASPCRGKRPSA